MKSVLCVIKKLITMVHCYKMSTVEHFVYIFRIFSLLLLIRNGHSVPIDYCLQPLNTSDCNMLPTPVFSYYKPGSRCEIDFWRGCPTWNKFPDEYLCSHYCIGKLLGLNNTEQNTIVDFKPDPPKPKDPCKGVLNSSVCADNKHLVYTYVNNSCIEAPWYGCETDNKFDDENSCKVTCVKQEVDELNNWKQQLLLLQPDEVKEIDNLIDIMDEESTTKSTATTTQPVTTESAEPVGATEGTTTEVATTEAPSTEAPTTTSTTELTTKTTELPGDADEVVTT